MSLNESDNNKWYLSQEPVHLNALDSKSILKHVKDALSNPECPFREKLLHAMKTLKSALHEYGAKGLTLSFNGGKDCTLLLYLMTAARADYFESHPHEPDYPPRALYVKSQFPFPQVDAFVNYCVQVYKLDTMSIFGDMRNALQMFLDSSCFSKAILIGTRRTDPHGPTLETFSPTDGNWPSVMRVHPILDWSYGDVWSAIRYFGIPYCSLYDQGYTSLGSTNDTLPNPDLHLSPGKYLPGYELKDGSKERLGRVQKK